ncbi:helix-turn-helix domain-containing protein [Saccharopolyspora sp. TS4A08]|uniref:Helix-turn-helix domain-containing protein n=1 Tax=Saccharopolyspora ipomoeae TaxID=3042027 RepID=A0ABT6PQ49_9PSEU|nr:PucR family transcriptional regulator [Saccharopolyspora sp. TS4A08]MDI2030132.1 helix-turn-helix domain-containing protein [Saccharopolyspora sp. TS4A08]
MAIDVGSGSVREGGPREGTQFGVGRRTDPRRRISAPHNERSAPQVEKGCARQLFTALPKEIADGFRPYVTPLAKAIVREIQGVVPEYAQPLDTAFGVYFTRGIEQAILQPLNNIREEEDGADDWSEYFRLMGKLEFAAGRGLQSLQTAYRVGGRVAWRHFAEFGKKLDVQVDLMCLCAEAIFAYVDDLSKLSFEGYSTAQERAVGTLARRRRRLLELLLAEPPASPQSVGDLADSARWDVPEWVTLVALEPVSDDPDDPRLDDDVLVNLEGATPCLLIPDEPRDPAGLVAELGGRRAAMAPKVRIGDAARSLRWARHAIDLVQRGVLPNRALTRCADHLTTLWLLSDEFLVTQIGARCLTPLDELTVKQRARLSETLLVWLQSRGSARELAERLGIHPQTVRYRMNKLEQLFGDRLTDPDDRLDMELALRAETLLMRG